MAVFFADGRTIGIQVTEIDPHSEPGLARNKEKKEANAAAKTASDSPYFIWGQNDAAIVLDTVTRAIKRKMVLAAGHSLDGFNEVWLLLCAGIPERGAVGSTLIMTPWLGAEDLNVATKNHLQTSRYDRCFVLPVLGTEQAFYSWGRGSDWKKQVGLEDIQDLPRPAYVSDLMEAARDGNQQELDRLIDEECRKIIAEIQGDAPKP